MNAAHVMGKVPSSAGNGVGNGVGKRLSLALVSVGV